MNLSTSPVCVQPVGVVVAAALADHGQTALAIPRQLYDVIISAWRRSHYSRSMLDWAILEMSCLYATWLERGECKFSQRRLDATSDRLRKLVVSIFRDLESVDLAETIGDYAIGVTSYVRRFSLPVLRGSTGDLGSLLRDAANCPGTDHLRGGKSAITNRDGLGCSGEVVLDGCQYVVVMIDGDLMRSRRDNWGRAAADYGWSNCEVSESVYGDLVARALASIELPHDLESIAATPEDLYNLRQFVETVQEAKNAGNAWVFEIRNRYYHPLTNLPRLVRALCTMAGETVGTADIHATYWCVLTADLDDCAERTELIGLLQNKRFYAALAAECGMRCDREFKIRCNAQCLFWWYYWDPDKCAISGALSRRFPRLAAKIKAMRLRMSVGDLSDWLCAGERAVMEPAWLEVGQLGPSLVIHDALLVPLSLIRAARIAIENHALSAWGFTPHVSG